jgi:hypothetical protein
MDKIKENGITFKYGAVYCTEVQNGTYHPETDRAQLRQEVEVTSLFSKRTAQNDLNVALFSNKELGIEETPQTYISERVAFVDVPKGSTVHDINEYLKQEKLKNLTLYIIRSNHPILTNIEKAVLAAGKTNNTVETLSEKQIARYSKKHANEEKRNQIMLKNGKPFYSRTCVSTVRKADEDMRTEDPNDVTLHPVMAQELQLLQI